MPKPTHAIPHLDVAGEIRGRDALQTWQDAISGRAPAVDADNSFALKQWRRMVDFTSGGDGGGNG